MKRLHILAEGQSEERFVKDILRPHLGPFGLDVKVSVVKTSRTSAGTARREGGALEDLYLDDLRCIAREIPGGIARLPNLEGDWAEGDSRKLSSLRRVA